MQPRPAVAMERWFPELLSNHEPIIASASPLRRDAMAQTLVQEKLFSRANESRMETVKTVSLFPKFGPPGYSRGVNERSDRVFATDSGVGFAIHCRDAKSFIMPLYGELAKFDTPLKGENDALQTVYI